MRYKLGFIFFIVLGLSACSIGQAPTPLNTLDLGGSLPDGVCQGSSKQTEPLVISLVEASPQLNGLSVLWRETSQGMAHAYATYRWWASPDRLFDQRLRECFSNTRPVLDRVNAPNQAVLRVSLERFEQVFENGRSVGVVSARALLQKNGQPVMAKVFTKQQDALSQDAVGGAKALRDISTALVSDIQQWVDSVR